MRCCVWKGLGLKHVISDLLLGGALVYGESGNPDPSFSSHLSLALQTLGVHAEFLPASAHRCITRTRLAHVRHIRQKRPERILHGVIEETIWIRCSLPLRDPLIKSILHAPCEFLNTRMEHGFNIWNVIYMICEEPCCENSRIALIPPLRLLDDIHLCNRTCGKSGAVEGSVP
ncbi:hypothetical protein LDENG_00096400 [Lucifuga dentata]|nr:hypothetical protein LDENG_00096400 [Lucifuga dentata]